MAHCVPKYRPFTKEQELVVISKQKYYSLVVEKLFVNYKEIFDTFLPLYLVCFKDSPSIITVSSHKRSN